MTAAVDERRRARAPDDAPPVLLRIARELALSGLGSTRGRTREDPPEGWAREEYEQRILELIPGAVLRHCLATAQRLMAITTAPPSHDCMGIPADGWHEELAERLVGISAHLSEQSCGVFSGEVHRLRHIVSIAALQVKRIPGMAAEITRLREARAAPPPPPDKDALSLTVEEVAGLIMLAFGVLPSEFHSDHNRSIQLRAKSASRSILSRLRSGGPNV